MLNHHNHELYRNTYADDTTTLQNTTVSRPVEKHKSSDLENKELQSVPRLEEIINSCRNKKLNEKTKEGESMKSPKFMDPVEPVEPAKSPLKIIISDSESPQPKASKEKYPKKPSKKKYGKQRMKVMEDSESGGYVESDSDYDLSDGLFDMPSHQIDSSSN